MNKNFMRVEDVAAELEVSKSFAYKMIHKLNAELEKMGYITVAGRVSRKYFLEKLGYLREDNNERRD